MLIRSSGPIDDNFQLLTLGNTCHYVYGSPKQYALFDPGVSGQCSMLLKRLESSGYNLRNLSQIFLTHLHADRISAIPLLRRFCKFQVAGSPAMRAKLSSEAFLRQIYDEDVALSKDFQAAANDPVMSFEEFKTLLKIDRVVNDSEIVTIDGNLPLRVLSLPGHCEESLAFQILPKNHLIVDEGLGYYRGRELAAPGGDWSQDDAARSIAKISKIEITTLCLPSEGVLTGQLVRKHLQTIIQNTKDLFDECARAQLIGIPDEEIRASVQQGFYTSAHADPMLRNCLNRSFEAVWKQVLARRIPS